MAAQVCIYGKDVELVKTRAMILRKAAFEVEMQSIGHEFVLPTQHSAGLFVLCNSLALAEQVVLAEHLGKISPHSKVLLLRQVSGEPMGVSGVQLEVADGNPLALLAACKRLTNS